MIFTFFCEVLPREVRGRFMVVLAMFWMVGGIMIAAFAWGILSPNVGSAAIWCAKLIIFMAWFTRNAPATLR